jgi:antirestriction protein ArdC
MNEVGKIVADALDLGQIPWRFSSSFLPRQIVSGRLFASVNPILLQIAAAKMNSTSPWWATKIQWELCGHTVIVGPDDGVQLPGKEDEVYNLAQTVGEFPLLPPKPVVPGAAFDTIIDRAGIKIEYGVDATCQYERDKDLIRIPYPFMFICADCFFHALSHEIAHWSESRMDFDRSTAVNELRADVLSGYFCASLGIKPVAAHLRSQHDKFAGAWASGIRADPGLLFQVCNNVTATVTWLLGIIGMEVRWEMSPGITDCDQVPNGAL